MCDFVDVLNLLLDRVSINSFLFRVPKKSVLFSLSTYPSYILHNGKFNTFQRLDAKIL